MFSVSYNIGRVDIIHTEDLHGNFEGRTEEQTRPLRRVIRHPDIYRGLLYDITIHAARIYI